MAENMDVPMAQVVRTIYRAASHPGNYENTAASWWPTSLWGRWPRARYAPGFIDSFSILLRTRLLPDGMWDDLVFPLGQALIDWLLGRRRWRRAGREAAAGAFQEGGSSGVKGAKKDR